MTAPLHHRIESIHFARTRFGDLKLRPSVVQAIGENPERAETLFTATEAALDVFTGAKLLGLREHRPMEGA